jgi:O-antigen/teichoic acid export membrane protein
VWPITLSEARDAESNFQRTRDGWNAAHLGLVFAGIVFSVLGPEIIALLTNGKFKDAAPLAALGVAYLLLQNIGKPQVGYMYAYGYGSAYAKLSLAAIGLSAVAALPAISAFGMWGAIATLFMQQLLMRVGVQIFVARRQRMPFQDGLAIAGCLIILGIVGTNVAFDLPLETRLAELVISACIFALFARRGLAGLQKSGRGPL